MEEVIWRINSCDRKWWLKNLGGIPGIPLQEPTFLQQGSFCTLASRPNTKVYKGIGTSAGINEPRKENYSRGLILFILNALGGTVPSCSGNTIQEHSFKPMLNCLATLLAANPRPSMQHKCLPGLSETNNVSWQDGTSQTVCSQGLQVVELVIYIYIFF